MSGEGWPAGVALDSMAALDHLGEWACADCGVAHQPFTLREADGTAICETWFADHMYRPTPPR